VKPQPSEICEAPLYVFDDVKPDSAVATLRWEKLSVAFKIGVNVHEIVRDSPPNQFQGLPPILLERMGRCRHLSAH
jgi:hypothetical protein